MVKSLISEIKIMCKLSSFLTIQKPNYRQFFVTGPAVVLNLTAFDGKNFMTWRAKMELWLAAMHCVDGENPST
jgi:hypothetical protein